MNKNENRVAIVTGAARNIGRAIAKKLAVEGITVVVNALNDKRAADSVTQEIISSGGNAITFMADITDERAVNDMINATIKQFGNLDILITNASVRSQIPFAEMTLNDWHKVLSVPLDGTFLCAKAALPYFKIRSWGRIITLGGVSAYIGTPERVHLLTAKAGLVGLTRGLAAELAPFGVTCNVISPGHINTVRPLSAGARPPLTNLPPIERMGEPEEVASLANFLCSEEAGYITGQTLHVNGGLYLGT